MIKRFIAAATATLALVAFAPAGAAEVNCKQTPAAIRALAQNSATPDADKAIKLVATGEKLCAADARFEAGKKFAAAAKLLGTELAALTNAPTAQ